MYIECGDSGVLKSLVSWSGNKKIMINIYLEIWAWEWNNVNSCLTFQNL